MTIRFGHSKTMLALLEAALTVILILLIAKLIWVFAKPNETALPAQIIPISRQDTPKTKAISTNILTRFDPFHRGQMTSAEAPATISAPETTLNLKVYGMRADLSGDTSSAIIQTPDNKQSIYFLGEEIISGVTLKSVDIDFVILDRNGTLERLSRQGRTENDIAEEKGDATSALSFKAASMFNDVRLYPYREGRTMIGYKVSPRRGGADLEEYGFVRNDIITAINGEDLTQTRINMPNLIKTLKMSRFASIQIIRDDVPMTLEVTLK